jgi:hypothetical protein
MATSTNSTKGDSQTTPGRILINGVKAVADVGILPGASLLADGDVKSGALHAVGGLLAGFVFGPIGWLAFSADAFSKSVSGKNLHQHFVSVEKAAD